jgi:hypothetical protein
VLAVLAERDAPLFVHPGPAPAGGAVPAWWPALTAYVAETAAAWHAFLAWGRPAHPDLRVIFALLAGLAPLHHERLRARGGPPGAVHDPRVFYDTSSYGREALDAMVRAVGVDQLVHGSDRPVTAPLAGTPLGPAAAAAMREVNPARLLGRVGVAA